MKAARFAFAVRCLWIALSLIRAMEGWTAPELKRVLILDSFGRDVSPYSHGVISLRTTLAREFGEPVDVHEVSLESARFPDPEQGMAFMAFLRSRFGNQKPDVVVPAGAPAAKFMAQHRAEFFPHIPVVFMGVDPRLVPPAMLRSNATLFTQKVNLPGMVEDILQLQPETTNVVVILGASPLEQFWAGECRREFQRFTNRVGFTWLNGLPLSQVLRQVALQPPRSFVLFGMFVMDPDGVPFDHEDALFRLRAAAKVPIFGYFSGQFGNGTIGGRLYQESEVGSDAARAVIQVLRGARASDISPKVIEDPVRVYDSRELVRWKIPESQLPPGSLIQFREPSFWQLYRGWIVGVVAFCLIQTALIAGLLVSRARRHQAEDTARSLSQRLLKAQEEERSRLARELHDDLTQRIARLAIDAGRAEQGTSEVPPAQAMRGLREGLIHLSEDVHDLSYRLHPLVLEELGLADALKGECERFARQHSISVDVKVRDVPARLSPDKVLCLFRVAQSALRNVARHAGACAVEVTLRGLEDGLQLAVRDDGGGFDPAALLSRPTLGFASMRERINLVSGELDIESSPGQGATIVAWVPHSPGKS